MRLDSWNRRAFTPKRAGNLATEVDGGWINYKKANGEWSPIDCILVKDERGFHVVNAPFEFNAPLMSGGEVTFNVNNRYDIFNKTDITADPFSQTMKAFGVGNVAGELYDINGDGRLDAVKYPNAYGIGIHLVYYVRHGVSPELKELVQFDQELLIATDYEFEITYSGKVEISPRRLPDNTTRRQHRADSEVILNTPQILKHDEGFYIRKHNEPQKRGIGIKTPIIWDSAGKREVIDVDIRKGVGANTYILTKHIKASFFNDVTYPVFTDTTSTFFPDGFPTTTSSDGFAGRGGAAQTWASIHDGVGTFASDTQDTALIGQLSMSNQVDKFTSMRKGLFSFDLSEIESDVTIDDTEFIASSRSSADTSAALPEINVFSANPNSNTAVIASDYDKLGTIPFSDTPRTVAQFSGAGDANPFPFNAIGIAAVTTAITTNGIINLGMRESKYDAPNLAPTWQAFGAWEFNMDMAETTSGPEFRPKLVVEFTPPPIPGEPTPLFLRMYEHLLPNSKAWHI